MLHPGRSATGGSWPPMRFASLARLASAGAGVAVLAGPGDLDAAVEVAARADLSPSHVLAANERLLDLVPMIRGAGRLVSAHAALAGLAAASGVPSVLLDGRDSSGDPPTSGAGEHETTLLGISIGEVLGALDRIGEQAS